MLIFYAKFLFLYSGLGLGIWGAIKFYFLVRVIESHWFVWVSQSNHIPMAIEDDDAKPWFPLQVNSFSSIIEAEILRTHIVFLMIVTCVWLSRQHGYIHCFRLGSVSSFVVFPF